MTTEGLNLLKEFEGFRCEAYLCPAGVWTIGYGNTRYEDGSKVKKGDVINRENAEKLLEFHTYEYENAIKTSLHNNRIVLAPRRLDALVLLAYNIGLPAFLKSTLYKRIKEDPNNFKDIEYQWKRWNKAGGRELDGLTIRRAKEFELYRRGVLGRYTEAERAEKFGL